MSTASQRYATPAPGEERVRYRLTRRLLDAGEVDVMSSLAFPLPATAMSGLVGVPAADPVALRSAAAAMQQIRAYFFEPTN